jgi:hypothetical protein
MEIKKTDSDFGKGFFYCLNLYGQHVMYLNHWLEIYSEMRTKNKDLFRDESAVSIWANGAKDHLYELEVPFKYAGTEIGKLAVEIKDIIFYLDRGFLMPKDPKMPSSKKLVEKATKNLNRIFFLLDQEIGATPIKGTYE